MRFSTVAASAVLIGFAAALPNSVVYETELVTITSCSPDKPDCPYATPTPVEPTPEYPEPTPEYPEVTTTPCPTSTDIYVPPTYPNATASYPPHEPSSYPEEPEYPTPSDEPHPEEPEYPTHPEPEYPCEGGYDCTPPPYVPTGTGVPYPPANTSTSVPTYPPESEGAAGKMGVSLIAVAGAAVLALFA